MTTPSPSDPRFELGKLYRFTARGKQYLCQYGYNGELRIVVFRNDGNDFDGDEEMNIDEVDKLGADDNFILLEVQPHGPITVPQHKLTVKILTPSSQIGWLDILAEYITPVKRSSRTKNKKV